MKKMLLICSFILLLGITLYGTSEPWNKDLSVKVGGFLLKPYKYGLYLSPIQGVFYNFSPYDAYLKYEDGSTENLIEKNANTVAYELTAQATMLKEKGDIIKSYFQFSNPTVTFFADNTNIRMKPKTEENRAYVWVENIPNRIRENSLVLTMSFNEFDYVLDNNGNVYYPIGKNISDVLKATPEEIFKIGNEASDTYGTTDLLIISDKHNSIIKIPYDPEAYESVKVDGENLLIEVELLSYKKKLVVELYNSMEDVL